MPREETRAACEFEDSGAADMRGEYALDVDDDGAGDGAVVDGVVGGGQRVVLGRGDVCHCEIR